MGFCLPLRSGVGRGQGVKRPAAGDLERQQAKPLFVINALPLHPCPFGKNDAKFSNTVASMLISPPTNSHPFLSRFWR